MDAQSYLHLQLQLEGRAIRDGRFLIQLPDAAEVCPLVLIAQLATGERTVYLHDTLPSRLQGAMLQWSTVGAFAARGTLVDLVAKHGFSVEHGHYKTYCFPNQPNDIAPDVMRYAKHDPGVAAFGFDGFADDVYALSQDERIVSACVSVRENDACAEAWVMTHAAYRRRGYAQLVIRAWANQLVTRQKVPLYSHHIDNAGSAAVARHLGLIPLFEVMSIAPRAG